MKTILITGCSSGFGLEILKASLEKGHQVIATVRNNSKKLVLLNQFSTKAKQNLKVITYEYLNENSAVLLANKLIAMNASIDVLVNNLGQAYTGPTNEIDEAILDQQMQTNFYSAAILTNKLYSNLRNNRGKVIHIGSAANHIPIPFMAAYIAAKSALRSYTEVMAYEFNSDGIDVCIVEPSGYRTNFVNNSLEWSEKDKDMPVSYSAFKLFQAKLLSRVGSPQASEIGNLVAKLIDKKKMPLVVSIGPGTRFYKTLRALLPDSAYLWFLKRLYQRKNIA